MTRFDHDNLKTLFLKCFGIKKNVIKWSHSLVGQTHCRTNAQVTVPEKHDREQARQISGSAAQ